MRPELTVRYCPKCGHPVHVRELWDGIRFMLIPTDEDGLTLRTVCSECGDMLLSRDLVSEAPEKEVAQEPQHKRHAEPLTAWEKAFMPFRRPFGPGVTTIFDVPVHDADMPESKPETEPEPERPSTYRVALLKINQIEPWLNLTPDYKLVEAIPFTLGTGRQRFLVFKELRAERPLSFYIG